MNIYAHGNLDVSEHKDVTYKNALADAVKWEVGDFGTKCVNV